MFALIRNASLSTHNIWFYGKLEKIFIDLSPNIPSYQVQCGFLCDCVIKMSSGLIVLIVRMDVLDPGANRPKLQLRSFLTISTISSGLSIKWLGWYLEIESIRSTWGKSVQIQSFHNNSNTDGSFTMANSNSFFSLYKIPLAPENKYIGKFSYFIMKLYVVCTH